MNFFKRVIERPVERVSLLELNFFAPWWNVFVQQKKSIALILCASTASNSLKTLFPLLVCWALETSSVFNLFLVTLLYCAQEMVDWLFVNALFLQFYFRTTESFRYSAYKTLLAAQPLSQPQQSHGVGIGKIRRTMDAYKDLMSNVYEDIVPLIISLITTMITLMFFNVYLGLLSSIGIIAVTATFCAMVITKTKIIERNANSDDDHANHAGAESLKHARLIHARGGVTHMQTFLAERHLSVARSMVRLYMTYRFMQGIFMLTYIMSVSALTLCLLYLMQQGTVDSMTALALVATFLRSTQPLLKLDKRIRKVLSAYRKITDCFNFVRQHGSAAEHSTRGIAHHAYIHTVTLEADALQLAYPHAAPLVQGCSFYISLSTTAQAPLYQLVGPLGCGKSTLLCALAGLFKPQHGIIRINGCDVCALHEEERKKLVLLQGQNENILNETVRYNMMFGLPHDAYTDRDLVELLMRVDLWDLFENKQGLQTIIGEGALQLSRDQQQRLNNASFWLRVMYYKPALVLLDDPLNGIEQQHVHTIKKLIQELCQHRVGIVASYVSQAWGMRAENIECRDILNATVQNPYRITSHAESHRVYGAQQTEL